MSVVEGVWKQQTALRCLRYITGNTLKLQKGHFGAPMSTSNYTMSQENKPLYSSLARDFAKCQPVFTARRYMLAQYMLSSRARPSVRPSVCLSVTSRCCIETSWVLAWRLPSAYPTPCYKEIWVSTKMEGTPLWNLVPNSRLRQFRHGKSIALSTKLVVIVVVNGRACWRHLYDNRRVVAVYYTSACCNPLTPLLRFVVDLLYNLFLQLIRFWLT